MFSSTIRDVLSTAAAKAFATYGNTGINVVPVSMIRVNDDTIWLFDFFMDKTVQNLDVKAPVALTAWTDMKGIQVKADAQYITDGDEFTEAVDAFLADIPKRADLQANVLSRYTELKNSALA